jgi:hypothetical protein
MKKKTETKCTYKQDLRRRKVFFSLSLDGFRLIYEVRIFMDDELNHFFVWCSQVQRIDDCFPYVAIKGIHVSFSIFIGTWKC